MAGKRIEVWCGEVRVFESDRDADVRVILEGQEVLALAAVPSYGEPEEAGARPPLMGVDVSVKSLDKAGKMAEVHKRKFPGETT